MQITKMHILEYLSNTLDEACREEVEQAMLHNAELQQFYDERLAFRNSFGKNGWTFDAEEESAEEAEAELLTANPDFDRYADFPPEEAAFYFLRDALMKMSGRPELPNTVNTSMHFSAVYDPSIADLADHRLAADDKYPKRKPASDRPNQDTSQSKELLWCEVPAEKKILLRFVDFLNRFQGQEKFAIRIFVECRSTRQDPFKQIDAGEIVFTKLQNNHYCGEILYLPNHNPGPPLDLSAILIKGIKGESDAC